MTTMRRPDSPARERANELIAAWDGRPGPLGSLLGRVTPVDQVGVEGRVDALKRRSIKKASKMWALDLAIRMMDLTTLEGKDTLGKVHAMCVKAMRPQPGDPTIPSVAAVCVYPALVAEAKEALKGSTVKVASVATGFPSGQTFRDIKIAETRAAVAAGADEIDMVIDRGAFLSGDFLTVFEEIVEVKEAAGEAHLKVILETGELETYDNVRRASVLAMAAGADFIKTSTGKVTARGDAAGHARDAGGDPRLRALDGPPGRHEAGGRDPDGQGGDPVPRGPVRDAGPALDVAGLVPLRGVVAAQRRADADRVPAHRAATRTPTTSRSTDVTVEPKAAEARSAALDALAEDYWQTLLAANPMYATALGDRRFDDRLDDPSPEAKERLRELTTTLRARAVAIDPAGLTTDDRVTRDALLAQIDSDVALLDADLAAWAVDPIDGPQAYAITAESIQPIATPEQGQAMVARWRAFGPWFEAHVANVQRELDAGRVGVRTPVEKALDQIDGLLAQPDEDGPFLAPLHVEHPDWTPDERGEIR